MKKHNYIIVGAGSAGCVLADKLSRNPNNQVLLLEAGGHDRSLWVAMPVGYGKLFTHAKHNWKYQTLAEPALAGRAAYWPRGKLVGGSGSINALVYCRGLPEDFDDWQSAGAKGWGWSQVQPHFDAIETMVRPDGIKHGNGPIHVQDVSQQIHPLNRHFFAAIRELQMPTTDNCNGPDAEGATVYRINTKNGVRCSSARGFLRPALHRPNLQLRTDTAVKRILIENGRATGVETLRAEKFYATTEVILSAGTIGSPQLLQLSGIGPGQLLKEHGIPLVFDNPNVGAHLQDHLAVSYYFKATEPTLNNVLYPWHGKLKGAIQYLLTRKGPLSLSVNQCGGLFRSSEDKAVPDMQLYFNPLSYSMKHLAGAKRMAPDSFSGFTLCPQPSRPSSRGQIRITTTASTTQPAINPNSLDTEKDQIDVIAAGRLCQKIMRTEALRKIVKSPLQPDLMGMDDAQILQDFRARAGTVFHPTSSCRMGENAETAVLDSELRVFGLQGLRVADASAFPNITSANTNAPVMMLAHRAAELILRAEC